MNNPDPAMNDPEELTVAEYAKRFNMSENTVRTKINRKKLKTIKGVRDGRETILIIVEPSMDHSKDDSEQFEIIQGTVEESFKNRNEQPSELFDFMRETLSTVQAYSSQLVELSRENERYKLLTDNSTRTANSLEQSIEQLKTELFEKEARIKQLEAVESPLSELNTRIAQLEQQLTEKDEQLRSLTKQLEDERAKGLITRLFGK
jgi:chromosome segregation ATPase